MNELPQRLDALALGSERWIGARRSELELQAELQGAGSAHRIELIR